MTAPVSEVGNEIADRGVSLEGIEHHGELNNQEAGPFGLVSWLHRQAVYLNGFPAKGLRVRAQEERQRSDAGREPARGGSPLAREVQNRRTRSRHPWTARSLRPRCS